MSDSENESIMLSVMSIFKIIRSRKSQRREWVRKINLERKLQGDFHALLPKLRTEYPDLFFNYLRVSVEQFDALSALMSIKLNRRETNMRSPLTPEERLSICLWYLATGNSYSSIAYAFRIGKSTAAVVIMETCQAIWEVMSPVFLKAPKGVEWKEISTNFFQKCNFPNCVGAIDGKHVVIQAPANCGSQYFNYKGSHSIVLMASCDANYVFTMVDIGNYGRMSDGGIFANSTIGKLITHCNILPSEETLPNRNVIAPYVFVADEAFPLKHNLMRPYSARDLTNETRIFNYRLLRARRCIENAFGILSSRWRILRSPIQCQPQNACLIVQACCCLHNFLIKFEKNKDNQHYCGRKFVDFPLPNGSIAPGLWRNDLCNSGFVALGNQSSNNYKKTTANVRETFKNYFNNEGVVQWQTTKLV